MMKELPILEPKDVYSMTLTDSLTEPPCVIARTRFGWVISSSPTSIMRARDLLERMAKR